MPSNTKFPHNPYGLSSSYSRSDVVIDGMKVKFDKVADLVPAELTVKGASQSMTARSFGKETSVCTIYIVLTPEFRQQLEGKIANLNQFMQSVRNQVEKIYQEVNGLDFFAVKVMDRLDFAEFDPILDSKIHVQLLGGGTTYNYSNANAGIMRPNTHDVLGSKAFAYVVAHEALHTYLLRLGKLLFNTPQFLNEYGDGHTDHQANGQYLPNLNMGGTVIQIIPGKVPQYRNSNPDTLVEKKEFQKIHPVQLYFIQDYPRYLTLEHARFDPMVMNMMGASFKARLAEIRSKSAANHAGKDSPIIEINAHEGYAHIKPNQDPATVPFH
jgi:hypothetical protein